MCLTSSIVRARQARASRAALVSLTLVFLASSLSACAGHRVGLLQPVAETVSGASKVDMLVATTREKALSPSLMFSGERSRALSFARIEISIPPDPNRQVGEVQWPQQSHGNPATDFVALRSENLDRPSATRWLHSATRAGHRRVLVFVHGFNNQFQDAVFRFAQITHDSGAEVTPVLFTWPSRASVFAYGYDRESAAFSRDAFETVLQTLVDDPDVAEVTILAHSMGNYLTLETLRQMAIRHGQVPSKIHDVLLAAPDVDAGLFLNDLADLGRHPPSMTLIVSRDDKALALSERVWGGAVRLGAIDPTAEPYRSTLQARKIQVVDLTDRAGDQLAHSKFAQSPEVVRAIGQRLATGQTIDDTHTSLGDRIAEATDSVAAGAGSAAALVLSAPAAIVDDDTRATYGDRVEDFRESLSSAAQSGTDLILPTR